jgi:hypothetical protein
LIFLGRPDTGLDLGTSSDLHSSSPTLPTLSRAADVHYYSCYGGLCPHDNVDDEPGLVFIVLGGGSSGVDDSLGSDCSALTVGIWVGIRNCGTVVVLVVEGGDIELAELATVAAAAAAVVVVLVVLVMVVLAVALQKQHSEGATSEPSQNTNRGRGGNRTKLVGRSSRSWDICQRTGERGKRRLRALVPLSHRYAGRAREVSRP